MMVTYTDLPAGLYRFRIGGFTVMGEPMGMEVSVPVNVPVSWCARAAPPDTVTIVFRLTEFMESPSRDKLARLRGRFFQRAGSCAHVPSGRHRTRK
jgi:hypothetical protein